MKALNLICGRPHRYLHTLIMLLSVILLPLLLYSQSVENEASDEVVYNESREVIWYTQSWVWAIVAAVLILVIGLVSRKGGDNQNGTLEKDDNNH